jgi:hypothetical protein
LARARDIRPGTAIHRRIASLAALLLLGRTVPAVSQSGGRIRVAPLIGIGTEAEERLRLDQITKRQSVGGFTIRSLSRSDTANGVDSTPVTHVTPIPIEYRSVYNSGLPYSLNDGPMWAGRGWNQSLTGGVSIKTGRYRVVLAPTLLSEQNEDFQVIPFADGSRSVWANPFHPQPESIDYPLRFGDRRITRLDAGQSSAELTAGPVVAGFGTENLWWGPGIRSAIVLSNNAPGFPHAYVQTRRPAHTKAGIFDAQWILGRLTESDFFDKDQSNDHPSINGVTLAWQPPFDTLLTIGMTRLVIGTNPMYGLWPASALDVVARKENRDQITSLFGRWVLPESGAEFYGEWARFAEPAGLQDFLEYPGHSEGYLVGLQWAHAAFARSTFRLQSELSYLEPDPSIRLRPTPATYTSDHVLQGFTERGQILGAATGPGSSSQWLAGDLFGRRWRFGVFGNRIRWDNAALFEPVTPSFRRMDVTMSGGARASFALYGMTISASFEHATRFNYLFQSYILGPSTFGGIDLVNNTLSLSLSSEQWR